MVHISKTQTFFNITKSIIILMRFKLVFPTDFSESTSKFRSSRLYMTYIFFRSHFQELKFLQGFSIKTLNRYSITIILKWHKLIIHILSIYYQYYWSDLRIISFIKIQIIKYNYLSLSETSNLAISVCLILSFSVQIFIPPYREQRFFISFSFTHFSASTVLRSVLYILAAISAPYWNTLHFFLCLEKDE